MLSNFTLPRVESFFGNLVPTAWQNVGNVSAVTFDITRSALLVKLAPDGAGVSRLILIEIPHPQVLRLRFDPRSLTLADYPEENSRAIVMDTMTDLRRVLESPMIALNAVAGGHEAIVSDVSGNLQLRVVINHQPFHMDVFRPDGSGGWFRVLEDENPSIQFRPVISYSVAGAASITEHQIVKRYRKPLTARYMGFGEKVGFDICKNGKQLTYINFDNWAHNKWYGAVDANGIAVPSEDREPLYNANPFFLEYDEANPQRSVYGLLLDNTGPAYMDIASSIAEVIQIGTLYDDLDLYFYFGQTTRDVLKLLTEFVGRARLKPRHVLGYHQGCYGYETQQQVEGIAQKYRDYRIPIDGLHIDIDIQDRYRMFTVDPNRFPDPTGMFTRLRSSGIKCSTNITPIISDEGGGYPVYTDGAARGMFIRDERSTGGANPTPPGATLYRGGVHYGADRRTRGVYSDLGRRDVRDWWGLQYRPLFLHGLEMVWQDMTTPDMEESWEHKFSDWKSFPLNLLITNDSRKMYTNLPGGESVASPSRTPVALARNLYAYNLVKATYHGLNHTPERRGLRNFIIARGGFTGMHRFAALWTGDNISDWSYLRVNILQSLAGGLSGQPISGADIGGFGPRSDHEKWVDPELLMRWTIAGAFLPWFRNHYTRKDNAKEFQEPWAFFENRHRVPAQDQWLYDAVVPVCRHFIQLRYRLIQLFYDAMFANTLTGAPIIRTLFLNDDHDYNLFYDKRWFNNNQWFVGDDLLVAPVVEKQSPTTQNGTRAVYLPNGSRWYCFMDNRRPLLAHMEGGQQIDFDAHLSTDPGHLPFLCPMYVRAGAILPTVELEQFIGERQIGGKPANPITINIYPAPSTGRGSVGSYELFEDDGISRSSAMLPAGPNPEYVGIDPLAQSHYRCTRITHRWSAPREREVRLTWQHNGYTPGVSHLFIAILHDPGEAFYGDGGASLQQIRLNGTVLDQLTGEMPENLADVLWNASDSCWYFNATINISFIKLSAPTGNDILELKYR
jgi:alpha-glucosidase